MIAYKLSSNEHHSNTRYTWRVRGEYEGAVGPWSATVSFFTPLPPPPPPPKAPPVIQSIGVSNARVEAGQQVQITAVVTDAETPVDRLAYEWAASPVNGTFIGSGPQVSWQAPLQQTTPDLLR